MNTLVFFSAFSFLALGLVFFYRPAWLLRVNKFAREKIFNDTILLLERRKKGLFFLLLSFIFFYWGYYRAQDVPGGLGASLISTDRLLYLSLQDLQAGRYRKTQSLCQRVLARDPRNAEALYQLAAAQFLLQDAVIARQTWARAEQMNPQVPDGEPFRTVSAAFQTAAAE